VSNDDPNITAKIALAHLNEFPDHYTGSGAWKTRQSATGRGGRTAETELETRSAARSSNTRFARGVRDGARRRRFDGALGDSRTTGDSGPRDGFQPDGLATRRPRAGPADVRRRCGARAAHAPAGAALPTR